MDIPKVSSAIGENLGKWDGKPKAISIAINVKQNVVVLKK